MFTLSGATKVIGIIGNPVEHSLSPAMQNAAIAACGIDYVYVPFNVKPDNLKLAVSGLRALGARGFNVTIPHKTAVIKYLDNLDQTAVVAGAVNTVLLNDGLLTGFNTDGNGFLNSLADDLNYVAGKGTVVIIGAGGAARGALAALCRTGVKKIIISNRSTDKAAVLAEDIHGRFPETLIELCPLELISDACLGDASLLVNTTSVGMNGDRIDTIDLARINRAAKVYDMVYSPKETPLLRESRLLGIPAANGLGMLAAQGELAFTIWTGKTPPKGLMQGVLNSICHT